MIYSKIQKMTMMEKYDLEKIKEKLLQKKEQRYSGILEFWKEHKPFKNEDDIPDVPVVKEDDYKNIIIPNIIRCGGIPKNELIINKVYLGSCRNSDKAKWNGKTFEYTRIKFGTSYIEEINHFEDDDGYDVFVPIKEVND